MARNTTKLATTSTTTDVLYDAIVVGLGGVGSFALRSLSKTHESTKVLGLERFHIGHEFGSSHGGTRLYRHAYFEHPNYVPLCLKSTEIFQELTEWKRNADKNAIPLLEECGVLVVSDGGKSNNYELIERCAESAKLFGIPTESMDTKDLRSNYGKCFQIPPDGNQYKGLLESGAGFVRPELALRYALDEAIENGAEIQEGVAVESILPAENDSSTYTIETSDGSTYRTKGVIVSAGAWASKLLPELDECLTVTRQVQAWFELPPKQEAPRVGWFLDRGKDVLPIYGIPADPRSENPMQSKIAIHGRTIEFDPETWDNDENANQPKRPDVTTEELNELKALVQDWIPGADEGIVRAKACLYTMTPDEHFIVDRKVSNSNVWYAAGLSGHGFKMTPALGQALADLVTQGTTELPVEFLSKSRFGNES
eukprot:CAMPEP_0116149614 /NCGR_PEP_ID=MMETSP0329-20121206/19066_1 /TAXON_ID=697910 /ORGANISM="Pseudo-nitzschia arenysensis, Strain B593" /LENGTH=425 /DNA_ID=CAMNT_0003645989 /DNA_START=70 /DNA_END=1347 /DNA_ORIENTATION=+